MIEYSVLTVFIHLASNYTEVCGLNLLVTSRTRKSPKCNWINHYHTRDLSNMHNFLLSLLISKTIQSAAVVSFLEHKLMTVGPFPLFCSCFIYYSNYFFMTWQPLS